MLLRHFVSTVLVMLFLSEGVSAADGNTYSNPTAGFEVTKPDSWSFLSAEENLENLKRVKLNEDEFKAAMLKYATAPMVVMAKYPEPHDDLNPSFKVNIKSFGPMKGTPSVKLIEMILAQIKSLYSDFQVVQAPTTVDVSGIASGYARVSYTLEVPEAGSYPTTSELWIVPNGDYFFMIGVGTRTDGPSEVTEEVEQIIASIKIGTANRDVQKP